MQFFRLPLIAVFAVFLAAQSNAAQESLSQAIQQGDTAAVARLLEGGVGPNITDEEGVPALMLATLFADAACVELLLESGADPNQADASGATALMWAIPDLEKVQLLIDHGADVNRQSDRLGRTPLLIAAAYPETSGLLELLLDHGADFDATDRSGFTALGLAMRFRRRRGVAVPGRERRRSERRGQRWSAARRVRLDPASDNRLSDVPGSPHCRECLGRCIELAEPRFDRAMDRARSQRQCSGWPLRHNAVDKSGIFGICGPGDVTTLD